MYAPNFNGFFEEVSKTPLPSSLLYCTINTEDGMWNRTSLEWQWPGMAGIPTFRWHLAPSGDTAWSPGGFSLLCSLRPPSTQQTCTILSAECLQLTAPLAFLILEMGSTTTATTCYFPPDVPATTISSVLRSRVSLQAASDSSQRKAEQGASASQAPL